VGIGFGITAREAKSNAISGKNKAIKMGGNQCFIVYDKNNMERVTPLEKQTDAQSSNTYNFKSISEASGISVNNIYQLKSIMDIYKKDTFTSLELSKEFGNSLRSMNRMIEKLELAGYIEVTGKRIVGKAGRPSRVLKLKI
jgi:predicted transcriptional regulator